MSFEPFWSYGHGVEGDYHVFVRAYFNEDEDALWGSQTQLLLIIPEPSLKIRKEITDRILKQGPWLSDFLWDNPRVNKEMEKPMSFEPDWGKILSHSSVTNQLKEYHRQLDTMIEEEIESRVEYHMKDVFIRLCRLESTKYEKENKAGYESNVADSMRGPGGEEVG